MLAGNGNKFVANGYLFAEKPSQAQAKSKFLHLSALNAKHVLSKISSQFQLYSTCTYIQCTLIEIEIEIEMKYKYTY